MHLFSPRRTLLVPALAFALLAGTLVATAAPASAEEPARVALKDATLPALVTDSTGIGLIASQGKTPLDPQATVFTAQADAETTSGLAVDTSSAASAGITVSDSSLNWKATALPKGAAVTLKTVTAGDAHKD